jgi:antitoxin component of MazEF toxin-antitoxin module
MTEAGRILPYSPGHYNARHWRKRLHRAGASLSVYLPYQLCRELGIVHNSEVLVYLVGKAIVLQAADEPHFTPLVAQRDLRVAEER